VTRRARELPEPGAAVILDTETTDLPGQTVELAVIDGATGKKLMDTLVKPTEPISDGARWVHGITDAMVADARPFQRSSRGCARSPRGRSSVPTTPISTGELSSATSGGLGSSHRTWNRRTPGIEASP
jgi:hypothetical protein